MDKDQSEETVDSTGFLTQAIQLDKAIELVGFGKFHYHMLFICGMLYIAAAISLTSVSFILASAQCDFQMMSVHKGLLNGATMFGMLAGSFIWGYISDSRGRRYALFYCLLMDGIFNLISSVSQFYSVFLFCRLMSGFGVSGCIVIVSYIGEFLCVKHREKFLCWLEIFWTIGMILLPCIAWMIIPLTFRIENDFFLFRSWNLFAIICSLPSIIFACVLMVLPESPKFLLVKGKHEETIECLKYVHRWNNKTNHKFPVSSLVLPDHINEPKNENFFWGLYKSVIELFTSKCLVLLIVTCVIQFCVTASYYMMMLWFPELMNRLRWYETTYKGPKNKTTICEIMSLNRIKLDDIILCNDDIDESVYTNIIIVGMACIPICIIIPLLVNRFGFKLLLGYPMIHQPGSYPNFFCSCKYEYIIAIITLIFWDFVVLGAFIFGSGVSAACMYLITSSTEYLIFASVYESFSSTAYGLIFCIAAEIFPTEYKGLAVAIGSMSGKVGSIIGNIALGIFIDAHCIIPIMITCSLLIFSGLLVFMLPNTRIPSIK